MISSVRREGKDRFQYDVTEKGVSIEKIIKERIRRGDGCDLYPSCLQCEIDPNQCPLNKDKRKVKSRLYNKKALDKRNKDLIEYLKTHTKHEACVKFNLGIHGINHVLRKHNEKI